MGSLFSIPPNSPQFNAHSSSHNKNRLKSSFLNHKTSYLELNSKYQLSNQRWTTIRQFEKLPSMVLRNFGKSLEKGINNLKNTTTAHLVSFSYKKHSDLAKINQFSINNELENNLSPDIIRKISFVSKNNSKLKDLLDNSNQLLISQDDKIFGEDSISKKNEIEKIEFIGSRFQEFEFCEN